MKTIGTFLKEERTKKKLSLSQLEKETKIKKSFLDLIEKDEWTNLPEYPIVLGFIKTIAKSLEVSETTAVAILRRDYPFDKKKITLNPKPDIKMRLTVSPKIIIAFLSSLLLCAFLGYLAYQYFQYISPPKVSVSIPVEGQEVAVGIIDVSGKTDSDATLAVNNQRIIVSETGDFSGKIEIGENTHQMIFVARSRFGKQTVVVRNIIPVKK